MKEKKKEIKRNTTNNINITLNNNEVKLKETKINRQIIKEK
jgi:hypothetical protein